MPLNKQYDQLIKIMLLGETAVGKTSIMSRFCEDVFSPHHINTLGIDFQSRTIEVNGKIIKIQVWDTAGQERFHTITASYYRGASGIFLVYDLTNIESFKCISNWMKAVKKYARSDVEMILIGNKTDLIHNRMLTSMDGDQLAKSFGIPYLETSAKLNDNIEKLPKESEAVRLDGKVKSRCC